MDAEATRQRSLLGRNARVVSDQEAVLLMREISWSVRVWQLDEEPQEAKAEGAKGQANTEKSQEGYNVGVSCKIKSGRGWGSV